MLPLSLSLVVLSCLSFAGAEPFHVPLLRKRAPVSIEDYANAAVALRGKYGYTNTTSDFPTSKRQNTAAVPIINQVGSPPVPRILN